MEIFKDCRSQYHCCCRHGFSDFGKSKAERKNDVSLLEEGKRNEEGSCMVNHTDYHGSGICHLCMQPQNVEKRIRRIKSYQLLFMKLCAIRETMKNIPLIKKAVSHPMGKQLIKDMGFRTEIFLYTGLAVNLLYCVIQVFMGVRYHSLWAGALAVFHILLADMRYQLLKKKDRDQGKNNILTEWQKYRSCGIILLCMTPFFASILILVVHKNGGGKYPGAAIYLMAVYTFCSVILSAASLVRFRKYRRPVLSAAKVVCLIKALVSALSLETAILTRYDNMNNPALRRGLTGTAGGAVCLLVMGTAVHMTVRGTKQCRTIQHDYRR